MTDRSWAQTEGPTITKKKEPEKGSGSGRKCDCFDLVNRAPPESTSSRRCVSEDGSLRVCCGKSHVGCEDFAGSGGWKEDHGKPSENQAGRRELRSNGIFNFISQLNIDQLHS